MLPPLQGCAGQPRLEFCETCWHVPGRQEGHQAPLTVIETQFDPPPLEEDQERSYGPEDAPRTYSRSKKVPEEGIANAPCKLALAHLLRCRLWHGVCWHGRRRRLTRGCPTHPTGLIHIRFTHAASFHRIAFATPSIARLTATAVARRTHTSPPAACPRSSPNAFTLPVYTITRSDRLSSDRRLWVAQKPRVVKVSRNVLIPVPRFGAMYQRPVTLNAGIRML